MNKQNLRWNVINWTHAQKITFKWQQEIYAASKDSNIRLVRKLQHKLTNSLAAKLIAVRRVTQDSQRSARAGIERIKKVKPKQRLDLALRLKIPSKASPLRKVWIPYSVTNKKPSLGVPRIYDRSLQFLMKLALEPEWEARFEANSYGFRPRRGCHDAVKATLDSILQDPKYVLNADIAKCFDKINHQVLLKKMGLRKGGFFKLIQYWLESGVLDGKTFQKTYYEAFLGIGISPFLANIALHGLELRLQKKISAQRFPNLTGELSRPNRRAQSIQVIRYANAFVILHSDKQVILTCKNLVMEFLGEQGLELCLAKLRLTHTLEITSNDTAEEGFDNKVGFNFLGFTFKQFKTKHRSYKTPTGESIGFKTLVYPSAPSLKKYQKKTHNLILKQGKALNQTDLIKELNPVIRSWASYFGISDANNIGCLVKQDYLIYLKLRKWAQRKTGSSSKGSQFWKKIKTNKWSFSTGQVTLITNRSYSQPIKSYQKVLGHRSPYDENQMYWAKRWAITPMLNRRVKALLKKQIGCCNWCGLLFVEEDSFKVDHIIPLLYKGKDIYANLQLLHRHCHDSKTASDLIKYAHRIQEAKT